MSFLFDTALTELPEVPGTIPEEIGYLTSLRTLVLSGNIIGGTIPTQIGLLSNLETFDISSNLLEGTVPTELGNLRSIKRININDNQLEGVIPIELSNLNYSELSLQKNHLHVNLTFLCTSLCAKKYVSVASGKQCPVQVTADCIEGVECECEIDCV